MKTNLLAPLVPFVGISRNFLDKFLTLSVDMRMGDAQLFRGRLHHCPHRGERAVIIAANALRQFRVLVVNVLFDLGTLTEELLQITSFYLKQEILKL